MIGLHDWLDVGEEEKRNQGQNEWMRLFTEGIQKKKSKQFYLDKLISNDCGTKEM